MQAAAPKKEANPLFEKRPKNFGTQLQLERGQRGLFADREFLSGV
jgi:hypothetical protein